MTSTVDDQTSQMETAGFAAWVRSLSKAVEERAAEALAGLFVEDAHWRDMVALTWDIGFVSGARTIAATFIERAVEMGLTGLSPASGLSAPRVVQRSGRSVIEGYFEFETNVGRAIGVARLLPDPAGPGGLRAWVCLTKLVDLKGSPSIMSPVRPAGLGFDRSDTTRNWQDRRSERLGFEDRDPEVLIVGGGHSGLFAAAYLDRLGVDTLVVDRFPRVGDNWRTRYKSLALHSRTDLVQFPYMTFPETFPEYLPKDKLAGWFEAYVDSMEINYWTSTEFVGGSYDADAGRWQVTVRHAVEPERLMRPRHLVMATGGVGATPCIPELPGLDSFRGTVVHTKHFGGGAQLAGRRVLVVGVGTSGHDVAYDLTEHGAEVTMLQRGPVSVVNLGSADLSFSLFFDGATPLEEADLISAAGFIKPVMVPYFAEFTARTNELDADTLRGLAAAGLRVDDGEDGTGWLGKFYSRNGGLYINVGCSERIVDGTIRVVQSDVLKTFTPGGAELADGTQLSFDAVVMATGFLNPQQEVRELLGDEIADRLGEISGFDDDGEIKNAWRPTVQRGLWFMVSGFASARIHGPLVAMQIKADLDGTWSAPHRLLDRHAGFSPAE